MLVKLAQFADVVQDRSGYGHVFGQGRIKIRVVVLILRHEIEYGLNDAANMFQPTTNKRMVIVGRRG